MKTKKKIEYYILAGEEGIKEMLVEADLNLSPLFFMVIKESSEIGKLIKREAKKQINKSKIGKKK